MKKWSRLLALLLTIALTVSLCLGGGVMTALAAESYTAASVEADVDTDETTSDEKENLLSSDEIEEDEDAEDASGLDMEAIENIVALFAALPDAADVAEMSSDEVDAVMQDALDAMDAFDALSYDECEYFIQNYPQLYQAVMEDLGSVLAGFYNNDVEVMSLLPLEERKAYLVVGDHDDVDISAVPIEMILSNLMDSNGNKIEIDDNAKEVWSYYKDYDENIIMDNYFVIEDGGTLDLSIFEEYDRYTLEMIVGDGNQLNPDNIRYIVTIYLSSTITGLVTYELYTQDEDGTRHKVEPDNVVVTSTTVGGLSGEERTFVVHGHEDGTEYYLGVNDPIDEHPFIECVVMSYADYLGYYIGQIYGFEYEYTSLSDQFINPNMKLTDAGYKNNWDVAEVTDTSIQVDKTFCFMYKNSLTGEVLSTKLITFAVVSDALSFDEQVYTYANNQKTNVELTSTTYTSVNEMEYNGFLYVPTDVTRIKKIWLNEGYSADDEYYFALQVHSPEWDDANSHVEKAVVGIYDSLEAAEEAEDISEQLLPTDDNVLGYKANYNIENGGVFFTIFFDDGSIEKFLIVFSEYIEDVDLNYVAEYSDVPIIGSKDPWFQVTGAEDTSGETIDTYVIENGKNINIDTMYGYGYQTVFINQDVEKFIPTFWRANDDAISVDKIYANGSAFNEGDALTFPEGENTFTATFSVIIKDSNGEHTKNYNVTFVKKTHGAQLYVAGPLAPEVRSVFLDEYHENKHDIFIANVGDEDLTDLWLDLDATNVELDDYWTIGGEGNNTLAACPDSFSLELESTSYGELSNVAKIRLVPPSSGKGGEISGTLKIYSGKEGDTENSELLATINLSDLAQNPEITTTNVDDAVLYVPYSYLITTNNMYDWVNVSYELVDGELPDGVELIEETGEIYGVPQETGTFTFTVSTYFESTSEKYAFTASVVELTLTVKDNTNANVYNSSDEGYSIEQAIGTDVGGYDFVLAEYADEVFWSEGGLVQFVDLWLNGEKLTEGEDYIAENGSTKITIYAETFSDKANKDGANTIAAEFRTTDKSSTNTSTNTNELKRTAQNFRIEIKQTGNDNNNAAGGNTGNGNTSGGNTNNGTTSGGNTTSGGTTGGNTNTGTASGGNTTSGGTTGGNTNTGTTSGGNTTSGVTTGGNTNNGTTSGGNTTSGGITGENTNSGNTIGENANSGGTTGGNVTTGGTNSNNAGRVTTSKAVTCTFHIVDVNGNAVSGLSLELHSTPQYATTDASGNATFSGVEFGQHTLYVKDKNGNTLAAKSFELVEASSTTLSGNSVTASNQSSLVLNVVYDNDNISINSVEQSSNLNIPKTGDDTWLEFWVVAMMVATLGVAILGVYVTHHSMFTYANDSKKYKSKRLVE
jgi:hypothetical protein